MCQELSKGLTILSNNDDPFLSAAKVASPPQTANLTTNSSKLMDDPLTLMRPPSSIVVNHVNLN